MFLIGNIQFSYKVNAMPIVIDYRFSPLRMVLHKRDKVNFDLFIRNTDPEKKNLTVRVILPAELAFSKGGFKTAELLRIEGIKPNEERILYFELYPKTNTTPGEKEIKVKVQEHYANFRYANREYEKTITLRVDE